MKSSALVPKSSKASSYIFVSSLRIEGSLVGRIRKRMNGLTGGWTPTCLTASQHPKLASLSPLASSSHSPYPSAPSASHLPTSSTHLQPCVPRRPSVGAPILGHGARQRQRKVVCFRVV
jgi:hypothetical protein